MTALSDRPSPGSDSPTVEELLAEAATASPERREELHERAIGASMGLARALAYRYRERGEPIDDLLQVAYTGLVLAIRRFKPESGNRFSTFATPTILGELRRYFRDQAWTIRPPRGVQEDLPRVRRATATLEQQNAGKPTTKQLAEFLDLSEGSVREAQQAAGHFSLASLEGAQEAGQLPASGLYPQVCEIERTTDRIAVRSMVGTLGDMNRQVIWLRFYEGLTQQQIADRLGVSQMQVSRLLRQILGQLREAASGDMPRDDETAAG